MLSRLRGPLPAFPRWHSPSLGPSSLLVPSPGQAALPGPALLIAPTWASPWVPQGWDGGGGNLFVVLGDRNTHGAAGASAAAESPAVSGA